MSISARGPQWSHAEERTTVRAAGLGRALLRGRESIWSGNPNAQLVAEASRLTPGTALDVGCGEGGDVIWLARQGWRVTGADFSAKGLARAARHAEEAGVADRIDWWQVDARTFAATAAPTIWSPPTSCIRRTAGWWT